MNIRNNITPSDTVEDFYTIHNLHNVKNNLVWNMYDPLFMWLFHTIICKGVYYRKNIENYREPSDTPIKGIHLSSLKKCIMRFYNMLEGIFNAWKILRNLIGCLGDWEVREHWQVMEKLKAPDQFLWLIKVLRSYEKQQTIICLLYET